MAKESPSPLLAAAFGKPPKEPKTSGKKTGEYPPKNPKANAKNGKRGETGATQVGERAASKGVKAETPKAAPMAMSPMPMKPPSVAAQLKEDAMYAKKNATRNWIEGRLTSEEHQKVHARADHVIRHAGKVHPEGMKLGEKPAKVKEKRSGLL